MSKSDIPNKKCKLFQKHSYRAKGNINGNIKKNFNFIDYL